MNGSNELMRIVLIMNIVLVLAVCVLVGKEFMKDSPKAYASGGAAGGKYIAVPIQFQQNREALIVIDTSSDAMIVYGLDTRGDVVYTASGRTMDQDFKYLLKMKDNFWGGVGPNDRAYYPAGLRDAITKMGGE
jgi:hypothetical protein